jgi:hypothetical protein
VQGHLHISPFKYVFITNQHSGRMPLTKTATEHDSELLYPHTLLRTYILEAYLNIQCPFYRSFEWTLLEKIPSKKFCIHISSQPYELQQVLLLKSRYYGSCYWIS